MVSVQIIDTKNVIRTGSASFNNHIEAYYTLVISS